MFEKNKYQKFVRSTQMICVVKDMLPDTVDLFAS